jgi:CDP-paratose 2-epimerase
LKKILITGSGGLIGSEAVKFYVTKGYSVYGIDNDMRSYFFGEKASTRWNINKLIKEFGDSYNHLDIDIRNKDKLEDVFKENKFNQVIHAAAQPSHDWAAKNPTLDFEINAVATLNLLELFRNYCPEATFIFVSTNKVYGDTPNFLELVELPTRWDLLENDKYYFGIDEKMSVDESTHSIFGVSKASADLMVQEYGRYFNLNTGVFRGGCLTGPLHSSAELHGFLSYVVKSVVLGLPYKIYGYLGKQVRDNIHAIDVINMFWHFGKNPKKGAVYNMGGGRENSISIIEALEKTQVIAQRNIEITYVDKPRVGDHKWYITDYSRFKSDYPEWNIENSLDEILVQMVNKFRNKD